MLFVQDQNFLTVFSPSSSILSRPFAATVPNWVTSRQRELSEPACSFSLLCRRHVGGQHDPQEEGEEEAESMVAAWSRGCWDKAVLARLAAIVKSSEKHIRLLLPVVLPPRLQPLPRSRRLRSGSDGEGGCRWRT